jgi:hypothetical protein
VRVVIKSKQAKSYVQLGIFLSLFVLFLKSELESNEFHHLIASGVNVWDMNRFVVGSKYYYIV